MITHLEPDILECEVKWALGSITTNKASGGDGIPVELFQILKDDAVKVSLRIFHSLLKEFKKMFDSVIFRSLCQEVLSYKVKYLSPGEFRLMISQVTIFKYIVSHLYHLFVHVLIKTLK